MDTGSSKIIHALWGLAFINFLLLLAPAWVLGVQIDVSFSHRIIPHGEFPDSLLVANEGAIPTTFTADQPIFPLDGPTPVEIVSENICTTVVPWDWIGTQYFRFLDQAGDTVAVAVHPEPVDPFLPSDFIHPVVNIITAPENLWDPEIGLYVWGNHENFLQRGSEWERSAVLEFYDAANEQVLMEPVGLRINEGYGRN